MTREGREDQRQRERGMRSALATRESARAVAASEACRGGIGADLKEPAGVLRCMLLCACALRSCCFGARPSGKLYDRPMRCFSPLSTPGVSTNVNLSRIGD